MWASRYIWESLKQSPENTEDNWVTMELNPPVFPFPPGTSTPISHSPKITRVSDLMGVTFPLVLLLFPVTSSPFNSAQSLFCACLLTPLTLPWHSSFNITSSLPPRGSLGPPSLGPELHLTPLTCAKYFKCNHFWDASGGRGDVSTMLLTWRTISWSLALGFLPHDAEATWSGLIQEDLPLTWASLGNCHKYLRQVRKWWWWWWGE